MRTKEEQDFLLKFGLRLREIRTKKGWTLEFVEEKGWEHWQYLQQIETGKKDIGLLTLKKLSQLYRIPISDFFKK